MKSTLIFKNIKEENESTWEDSTRVLGKFVSTELDVNYTDEEIHMFIGRVHREPRICKKSLQSKDFCLCSLWIGDSQQR